MKETINLLLNHPQGLWMQGLGSLKRSVGTALHIAIFEHTGRSQQLAGLVLRHGGISREDALRAVGSFSKPEKAVVDTTSNQQPAESSPVQTPRPPRKRRSRVHA